MQHAVHQLAPGEALAEDHAGLGDDAADDDGQIDKFGGSRELLKAKQPGPRTGQQGQLDAEEERRQLPGVVLVGVAVLDGVDHAQGRHQHHHQAAKHEVQSRQAVGGVDDELDHDEGQVPRHHHAAQHKVPRPKQQGGNAAGKC